MATPRNSGPKKPFFYAKHGEYAIFSAKNPCAQIWARGFFLPQKPFFFCYKYPFQGEYIRYDTKLAIRGFFSLTETYLRKKCSFQLSC